MAEKEETVSSFLSPAPPLSLPPLRPPPPPRLSSAIGLGSARASSCGSHASQGSPPQSLQSVPRSHLTSRVGEEEEESSSDGGEPEEERKDKVSRGKRNLPSSHRPSLAEGHESSQTRTRTRGWAHGGGRGWRLEEEEEAARRDEEAGGKERGGRGEKKKKVGERESRRNSSETFFLSFVLARSRPRLRCFSFLFSPARTTRHADTARVPKKSTARSSLRRRRRRKRWLDDSRMSIPPPSPPVLVAIVLLLLLLLLLLAAAAAPCSTSGSSPSSSEGRMTQR